MVEQMLRSRFLLPLVFVVALAGCSNVKDATEGPIDVDQGTNPIENIKDADLANCVAANLEASFVRTTDSDAIRTATVKLTAREGVQCKLDGTAAIALQAGATVIPSTQTSTDDPSTVKLADGDIAYFDLDFPTSPASATCTDVDTLSITTPSDSQSLLLPFDKSEVSVACPNVTVTVSALRSEV